METREKALSSYFEGIDSHSGTGGPLPEAHRTGVAVSMAIHAIFLFFFMMIPVADRTAVKTFHIAFTEGNVFSPQQNSDAGQGKTLKKATAGNRRLAPAEPGKATPQKRQMVAPAPLPEPEARPPLEPAKTPIAEKPVLPPTVQATKKDDFIASAAPPALNDGWIATDGHLSRNRHPSVDTGTSTAGHGQTERGGKGNSGIASTSAPGTGFGTGTSSGAVTGAGGPPPIETRFGETNAPRFIHRAMPVYPPLARRRGKEGRVVLTLLIDQTGKVQKIDVTEGAGFGLTEAAIEAVNRSTFAPAHVNGQKVASRAVLPIRFRLE